MWLVLRLLYKASMIFNEKVQYNILLVLFFLIPLKLTAMNNTMFDIEDLYLKVKDHEDLINVLPDEAGTSFPVPIIIKENNSIIVHMAFFHFYMGRTNKSTYYISSPRHKTVVRYSDASIVDTHPALSKSFGINWDDSNSVGEYIPDPNISYEQQVKRRKRLYALSLLSR